MKQKLILFSIHLIILCVSFQNAKTQTSQLSEIKLTTHISGTDFFHVNIKCDGDLTVEGAKGLESGSTLWDGSTAYELIVEQPEITFRGDNITIFVASQDSIHALDITKCPELEDLTCNMNYIKELDLSCSANLKYLLCTGNELTSIDLTHCPKLYQINIGNNEIRSLDLSRCLDLTFVTCYNTLIEELDLSGNSKLEELFCNNTLLKSLDLSKNLLLTKVNCDDNQDLTSILLPQSKVLTNLSCRNSNLNAIDLAPSTGLTEVLLANNQITSLDVNCEAIETIDIQNNELSQLSFDGCKKIMTITCYNNKLNAKATTELIESLPKQETSFWGNPRIYFLSTDNPAERNVILSEDVVSAKNKGWTVLGNDEASSTVTDYAGSPTYTVSLKVGEHGQAMLKGVSDLTSVPERTELTLITTPNEGYAVDQIFINEKLLPQDQKTFVIREETQISVTFKKITPIALVTAPLVSITPNPTDHFAEISGLSPYAPVVIVSMQGSTCYKTCADADGYVLLDLSNYINGVYMVHSEETILRLIVNH